MYAFPFKEDACVGGAPRWELQHALHDAAHMMLVLVAIIGWGAAAPRRQTLVSRAGGQTLYCYLLHVPLNPLICAPFWSRVYGWLAPGGEKSALQAVVMFAYALLVQLLLSFKPVLPSRFSEALGHPTRRSQQRMLALGFTCLVLGAVALMEPSRQAQSRRISATASRATTWNSQDICLLMDHEPLWPEECRTLLRTDHLKQLVRGDLRTLNAQEQLQKLVICLNREYACAHGHRFIYASSPSLAIWPRGELRDMWTALEDLEGTCVAAGATLGKLGAQPNSLPENERVRIPPTKDATIARMCRPLGSSQERASDSTRLARSVKWCKVAMMAEVFAKLPQCGVVAFLDSDVLIQDEAPLTQMNELSDWLSRPEQFFFISAEEYWNGWAPGSFMDTKGRNELSNTLVSTGFMMAKRDPRMISLLAKWWCSVDEPCEDSNAGCYRVDWSHEQRMINDGFFVAWAGRLGRELGEGMRRESNFGGFNTPEGKHVRHFWWKNDPKSLRAAAGVGLHRLSKWTLHGGAQMNMNQTCGVPKSFFAARSRLQPPRTEPPRTWPHSTLRTPWPRRTRTRLSAKNRTWPARIGPGPE